MKLRNPLLIPIVALLLSWVLRIWLGSLTYRIYSDDPAGDPRRLTRRGIYVFWHEMLLLPCMQIRHGFSVLSSQHADGELVAHLVRMLGGRAVRGSTGRLGLSALREMMRSGRVRHLAITPDGPRGPRRVLKPGAIFLASKTGNPVIPVGFAVRQCKRHRSWDRMVLPKPGTLAVAIIGNAVHVPEDLDRDGIETYRLKAQVALDEVQQRAEMKAAGRCEQAPTAATSAANSAHLLVPAT
jgi:lysophospholipid acyltransferase (LPLAT)-like uncharacterized protein